MESATCGALYEILIYRFLNIEKDAFGVKQQILFFNYFLQKIALADFSFSFTLFQGGYNLSSISKSMAMCTSVLLGDPPLSLITPLPPPHPSAVATINEVIRYHAPYWRSLRIHSQYTMSSSLFIVFFQFKYTPVVLLSPRVRAGLPALSKASWET